MIPSTSFTATSFTANRPGVAFVHGRTAAQARPVLRRAGQLLCLVIALSAASMVQAGSRPFDDLISLDGKRATDEATIGDGQWTLVMIWASDCHVCKDQKPIISAFHDAHKDHDARVFGVALDGRSGIEAVHHYLEEHPASFPNYIGEYPIIAINFQQLTEESLRGTPTYLLFDPAGELKAANGGPITVAALEKFIGRHSDEAAER